MLDISQVVSLIAALGLGSLLSQYALQGHARASVRAEALAALVAVERARRIRKGDFQATASELQTRALIARVPRYAVQEYLSYAEAAWSQVAFSDEVGNEESRGLTPSHALAVIEADMLSEMMWHPIWSRRLSNAIRRRLLNVKAAKLLAGAEDGGFALKVTETCRARNGVAPFEHRWMKRPPIS